MAGQTSYDVISEEGGPTGNIVSARATGLIPAKAIREGLAHVH